MRACTVSLLLGLLAWGGCADEDIAHPIVGTWQDVRWADSADVFNRAYTFTPDGALTIAMRRPPASDTTCALTYALSYDSVLTLTHAGNVEQIIARVADDTLTLHTPELTSTFHRVAE